MSPLPSAIIHRARRQLQQLTAGPRPDTVLLLPLPILLSTQLSQQAHGVWSDRTELTQNSGLHAQLMEALYHDGGITSTLVRAIEHDLVASLQPGRVDFSDTAALQAMSALATRLQGALQATRAFREAATTPSAFARLEQLWDVLAALDLYTAPRQRDEDDAVARALAKALYPFDIRTCRPLEVLLTMEVDFAAALQQAGVEEAGVDLERARALDRQRDLDAAHAARVPYANALVCALRLVRAAHAGEDVGPLAQACTRALAPVAPEPGTGHGAIG